MFVFVMKYVMSSCCPDLCVAVMRHDTSTTRRKGTVPQRRPPLESPGASGATPRPPRRSGVSSESSSSRSA